MAAADLRQRAGRAVALTIQAGRAVLPIARRRLRWLIVVAVLAGPVTLTASGLLGWALDASIATMILYAAALWAVLSAAGAALVVLVDARPPRRIAVTVLGAVAAVLLCAVPAGSFFTFAVDYSAGGAANPGAAVNIYFLSGPMGGFDGLGKADDSIEFDRVLCDDRRDELHEQAAGFAADLDRPHFLKIYPFDDKVTVTGDRATVVTQVEVSFAGSDPNRIITYTSDPVPWTFYTINVDGGWRVCQVDAPPICGTLVNCDPAPAPAAPVTPSPSTSPSSSPSATSDPLETLREEMRRCGPRDPFRDMRRPGDCPSTQPPPSPRRSGPGVRACEAAVDSPSRTARACSRQLAPAAPAGPFWPLR